MLITGIVWLESIVEKLARKHNVSQEEVEQIFLNTPRYRFLERGRITGEHVYSAYGCTNAGRYVTVVFIFKLGNRALIISARDMDRKERKQYGR
ncbi:MAG: BrnT family toxin [bacterium]|nr:BrnT family toxin [bacterium]